MFQVCRLKFMLKTLKYISRPKKSLLQFKRNFYVNQSSYYSSRKIDDENVLTMSEIKHKIMDRLGLTEEYTETPESREHLLQHVPKKEDLPARSMKDSFTSAIIPLSVNKTLQNRYVSFTRHVRLGRLLEDMDLFAVWVVHQHILVPNLDPGVNLPYTFVTILVDKIEFTDFIPRFNQNIRLSGHVSWVGTSSIEVVVWLEQKHNDVYRKITRALFLMASRNATNTKAAPVNPLVPSDAEEEKILSGGLSRKNRRQEVQGKSVLRTTPTNTEQQIIHNLFQLTKPKEALDFRTRILPPNSAWMSESIVTNTLPSFPENRNAHNRVFGGYLMRNALEISWVCGFLYGASRPKVEKICDISFQKPVSIYSFIKMTSQVIYTHENLMQIMTVADVINAENPKELTTTNIFHFTMSSGADNVRNIIPKSYQDAMWYLEGRRKFCYSMGISEEECLKNENL